MEKPVASPSSTQKLRFTEGPEVVFGHKNCQTSDAKWLALEELYEKMQRPNYYDIGGTYDKKTPEYWFTCKTEQVVDIYLLHLFVYKYSEGSFNISVSVGSEMMNDKKNNTVHLPLLLKEFEFHNTKSPVDVSSFDEVHVSPLEYVTTYSFTDLVVDSMKDKTFLIAVSFGSQKDSDKSMLTEIKLHHDFGDLLNDPVGADFTVETGDGEKFQVHKMILSTHSSVFKAMFKEETAESQNSYVKLVDVRAEDFRFMLEFIYTGTIKEVDSADFANLLVLADMYNLKGLWTLSQIALEKQLTLTNAAYTLVVADMYDADYLKNSTMKYLKKNASALDNNTFNEINNVDLMKQLFTYITTQ